MWFYWKPSRQLLTLTSTDNFEQAQKSPQLISWSNMPVNEKNIVQKDILIKWQSYNLTCWSQLSSDFCALSMTLKFLPFLRCVIPALRKLFFIINLFLLTKILKRNTKNHVSRQPTCTSESMRLAKMVSWMYTSSS